MKHTIGALRHRSESFKSKSLLRCEGLLRALAHGLWQVIVHQRTKLEIENKSREMTPRSSNLIKAMVCPGATVILTEKLTGHSALSHHLPAAARSRLVASYTTYFHSRRKIHAGKDNKVRAENHIQEARKLTFPQFHGSPRHSSSDAYD
jgi:hypothetical protein